MKAEEISKTLEANRVRLGKNEGEEIGGFAIIIPPNGTAAIEIMMMGTVPDAKTFYKYVADKCAEAMKDVPDPYGAVGMGGRR